MWAPGGQSSLALQGGAWLEEAQNKPLKIMVPVGLQKVFIDWVIDRKEEHCNKWHHSRTKKKRGIIIVLILPLGVHY